MIFDLAGTLVQTEKLKARSHARAAVEPCGSSLDEQAVIDAFPDVVGLSRRRVRQAYEIEPGSDPAECLVIEDSPAAVKAALAAGIRCVAVPTPFTRVRLHSSGPLAERGIVDDPTELMERSSCGIRPTSSDPIRSDHAKRPCRQRPQPESARYPRAGDLWIDVAQ